MNVYMGIDWSAKKHDIVVVNETGAIIAREVIPHQQSSFEKLNELRASLAVPADDCLVGMETAHNVLIDYLWGQGYNQVYVIPPTVVKGSRGRYSSSGARSDQRDAQLLADILRTDRSRLQPWRPDSLLTRQVRAKVSLIGHITKTIRRTAERLRANLIRYYPGALALFGGLEAQVTLAFLLEYTTPQAMSALTYEQFRVFCNGQHYPRHAIPKQYARLQASFPEASPETVAVYEDDTRYLARELLNLVRTKAAMKRELTKLFQQHPDALVFASLPGAGELLAPSLLAKFGDDRDRFPTASSLQALAGTCPVTDASGKRRVVKFRQGCDKAFRQIAQQWARASMRKSAWAPVYWEQVRARVRCDNDAFRRLANRWLAIAWKLWHTRQPYDEAYHLQQRLQRSKPLTN
jgi:transposase